MGQIAIVRHIKVERTNASLNARFRGYRYQFRGGCTLDNGYLDESAGVAGKRQTPF